MKTTHEDTTMASLKYLHWTPTRPASVPPHPAREAAVAALRAASAALARAARHLAQPAPRKAEADPRLEFYAEAGAPEGALYLDGRLVGHLTGVNRL
jgi:hypothetical protein